MTTMCVAFLREKLLEEATLWRSCYPDPGICSSPRGAEHTAAASNAKPEHGGSYLCRRKQEPEKPKLVTY